VEVRVKLIYMKLEGFSTRRLIWIIGVSLALGAGLSSLQPGNWFIGWAAFSIILFIAFCLFVISWHWASGGLGTAKKSRAAEDAEAEKSALPLVSGLTGSPRRALAWMMALAFSLRLLVGVGLYLALPVDGYDDADDRAGYVFTDAHRRDEQAYALASSDQSILSAFDRSFHTDQYGGLLAFSALIYRVFSPDAHRPLLLILVSAFISTLGLPFLYKSAYWLWGEKVAVVSGWIFALYPESILLGGAAMREPYLMTFSALALWGFVSWKEYGGLGKLINRHGEPVEPPSKRFTESNASAPSAARRDWWIWLALGLGGMLLVSPVVALVTLVIFAGWLYFTSERGRFSWWMAAFAILIFAAGLFLLSSSLNRQGQFDASSPFGIVGGFLRAAVKWDVYQLERGSGWVQKLFDEMPVWLRLPFVTIYGILQPVLPAAIVEPTTLTWKIIAILRAAGWYALLPALVFSLIAGPASGRRPERVEGAEKDRKVWLWLAVVCWFWILLTSLRGGGDQWDNPRYRAILFLWQALVAGNALVWWRGLDTAINRRGDARSRVEPHGPMALRRLRQRGVWFSQIIACEIILLIVFTQWYASRYFHWGSHLPFGWMVALILGLWVIVLVGGRLWLSRRMT
jgi:hypothetical protein